MPIYPETELGTLLATHHVDEVLLLVALGLWIGGVACPQLGHSADTPQAAAELEVFVRQGCLRW